MSYPTKRSETVPYRYDLFNMASWQDVPSVFRAIRADVNQGQGARCRGRKTKPSHAKPRRTRRERCLTGKMLIGFLTISSRLPFVSSRLRVGKGGHEPPD